MLDKELPIPLETDFTARGYQLIVTYFPTSAEQAEQRVEVKIMHPFDGKLAVGFGSNFAEAIESAKRMLELYP